MFSRSCFIFIGCLYTVINHNSDIVFFFYSLLKDEYDLFILHYEKEVLIHVLKSVHNYDFNFENKILYKRH